MKHNITFPVPSLVILPGSLSLSLAIVVPAVASPPLEASAVGL